VVNVSAIAQIFILYLVIYAILKRAKGSRVGQVLTGVGILAAAMFAFTFLFQFDVLSAIMRTLLVYLAISTVVIFQPEIRRVLSQVGAFGSLEKGRYGPDGAATPSFVAETIAALASRRIGALLAFERGISLKGYEETGVPLNATFSRELLECVFTPPMPLHDGGVTLRDGRVSAAHCVFPVSGNPDLDCGGMRHRAAVGLSEETDALVIAVSEETGMVAVAHNGRLIRYPADSCVPSLERWLSKALPNRNSQSRIAAFFTSKFLSRFSGRFSKGGGK
jgi:diadenylate cyclase